jgi:crossover junction endodeoxyribonuclease RuvC
VNGDIYLLLKKISANLQVDRIILGIDPGTNIMGYALIQISGKEMKLITLGVLQLGKIDDHAEKLKRIFDRTLSLINEYKADDMAVEAPFFGKNVQSMLKLGRAQGVAIAAAMYRNIPIAEYSPKKIKQSITGNGNASKEQVAAMLQSLLTFKDLPKYLDATDALAAAVCHYFQKGKKENGSKNYSGWKNFLTENPKRKV